MKCLGVVCILVIVILSKNMGDIERDIYTHSYLRYTENAQRYLYIYLKDFLLHGKVKVQ